MSLARRGGLSLKDGKIGRFNCLRQQILMPGEKMDVRIKGKIRLESLRERDVMRINADHLTFLTPIRWLWPEITDYIKQGPDTAEAVPTQGVVGFLPTLGLGAYDAGLMNIPKFFMDNYFRIYNEWVKWPEDPDATVLGPTWDGLPATPLQAIWNRCRYSATPDDTDDYQIDVSGATMDVRDLAETQALFKGGMKRDVMSFNRWMEIVNQVWRGDGSREVDQVPMLIDKTSIGVNPREIPAMDGASLGQWQSLFDFGVDHTIDGIVAPEHCILSHFIIIRFAPIIEGMHPMCGSVDWHEMVGDPEMLAAAKPREVLLSDVIPNGGATSLGFAPAGWQWKHGHDVISRNVDIRDSFPYSLVPTSQTNAKDATRIKDAFRSQALGDYMCDLYYTETSQQPIGDAMDSYFSGMFDDLQVGIGGRNQDFPHGGKSE